jgi:hypothetical protein
MGFIKYDNKTREVRKERRRKVRQKCKSML